ncbi:hypothetical protein G6F59_018437 [Rhizopus arrhizus]|nr:hypothetical protein G6F59_018437 [Rhizopus arrhizus]
MQGILLLLGHRAIQVVQLCDCRVVFQLVQQPAHAGQDRVGLHRAHRLQRTQRQLAGRVTPVAQELHEAAVVDVGFHPP